MKTAEQINSPQTGSFYSTVKHNPPSGASFHRGKSKQDYATPGDFRAAVIKKYGMPFFDLAASAHNFFGAHDSEYFGVGVDSLNEDWDSLTGLLWLNPPFDDISPWAKKCFESRKRHILFLVPASVGSNWFSEYVHNFAFVNFLNPRLCFDGKAPYPKDCILCEFGTPRIGYDVWHWK